jgi:O-succinylbenzoate synthase
VRAALGNEQHNRVDANGAWSAREAIAKLSLLEEVGIELAEQPVATLAEMALVRGEVAVPLAADESVTSAEHAHEAVAIGACDAATVKIAKVGGLTAALRVVEVLPVYLSSALDGPVGIAAAVHLAQALPRTGFSAHIAHGLATADLFDDSIAAVECEVKDAEIAPLDAPGFGVEIDEAALERARL